MRLPKPIPPAQQRPLSTQPFLKARYDPLTAEIISEDGMRLAIEMIEKHGAGPFVPMKTPLTLQWRREREAERQGEQAFDPNRGALGGYVDPPKLNLFPDPVPRARTDKERRELMAASDDERNEILDSMSVEEMQLWLDELKAMPDDWFDERGNPIPSSGKLFTG